IDDPNLKSPNLREKIMAGGGNRAEADRWLVTSEKLLASSDLHGAKSFAIRACESDPTRAQAADYILAICDILIAGEIRVTASNLPDWYSVLRLGRLTQSPEHVATQYRRLALLLNPSVNRLPFADKAFELVSDAWRVLSDPIRKSSYDRALQPSQLGQLGGASQLGGSFWTACPYCFVLFEYPRDYEECVMKCRDCKRAFQAVRIQKPPVVVEGEEDVYFCSWSVFPLGFSGEFNQAPATRTRKRSGAGGGKSVGRLDLNVELSNDVEEGGGVSGRRESNREVDNIIEGIGFFEGLDEFLSSLPILSVVGDDKIKAT
ncbi:hypothetical protein HID58_007740, partial [Brassica napus]